ncbi:ribosome maturation factor RimM [Arcticibacterium luteifluviistationis]|uniref:Ribosome maturation factor RimM n=1 Tax=Arcticibacterium luteifluviistationis TaxID=1784714 RepID=A0A2Z4G729_9BACT|nr:ribosome maturation factor RimM [Arcticibacterium luteifluviistationis]AWV96860.1 16S rRNA processing protein RimM [Arcticibacterium luteifluviistationis]
MTKEECYFLGKITKPHGLKGEVILWMDVDVPELYENMESVFLEVNGELVPYFFEDLQIRGKKSIAKFEDMETIEETESIINCEVYLPIDNLPVLDKKTFYYHELPGFQLKEEKTGEIIGVVTKVYEGAGQDLIAFEIEGTEVLVPISDDIVKEIERDNNILNVNLPEGLIEIYTES